MLDLTEIAYDIYNAIDAENIKLIGYFSSKNTIRKLVKTKDACGNYMVSSKYLFFADLQDNEVIIKFETAKIYSLEEILK
jgi:hypothetical protein